MNHPRLRSLLSAFLILLAACNSSSSPKASAAAPSGSSPAPASGGKAGAASYTASSPLSGQLSTGTITDPSLNNMVAATLTIPAGWKLQGIFPILPCTPGPSPVFRAYSPDGLMQYRMEPMIGWKWNPKFKLDQSGCSNISGVISAADVIQSYIGMMQGGVHVVGPMPVSAAFSQAAQTNATNANQSGARLPQAMQLDNTADTAALRVQVVNGSFVLEERIRAVRYCAVDKGGAANGGNCSARIEVLTAPLGQLDALAQLVDNNNLPKTVAAPQWWQDVLQRLSQQNQQQANARMAAANARDAAFSQMMNNNFQQSMARSASEHQQFMAQQESSFESSMNNANASMNARSTAASDMVDYALDQQTVSSPSGVQNVSSAYSQTWTNGNQYYQTNDPNTNPNGVLQGNWTLAAPVHGNGQPK